MSPEKQLLTYTFQASDILALFGITFFSWRPKAEPCPLHLWFLSASDLVFTSVTTLRVPACVLNQLCWLV